jgi:hypothetical protein
MLKNCLPVYLVPTGGTVFLLAVSGNTQKDPAMRKLTSDKYPGYLQYQLFCSPAFRELRAATKDIFILMCFEIDLHKKQDREKNRSTFVVKNRHEIKLPYDEIKKRLGYSHKTIWTAFKELFEHGFLDLVKMGGGKKGDPNIYKLCEEWRKWEPGQTIRTLPDKNFKTGWQKNKLNHSKHTPLNHSKHTYGVNHE